jgi:hypothetical protein
MPFYTVENDYLTSATNIEGLDFSLNETSKDEYTYPVAGWTWYADLEAAIAATGKLPENETTLS